MAWNQPALLFAMAGERIANPLSGIDYRGIVFNSGHIERVKIPSYLSV
ncbi:hypothetical protein [Roseiconus lacunae]|nr:hypothetical protein [Roseiconus lacunae]MCD0459369.1 hypothetical protein [Roseiconus lacunae]